MSAEIALRRPATPLWRSAWDGVWRSSGGPAFVALGVVVLVAAAVIGARGGNFLTVSNASDILTRSVALGVVAVGQTIVILIESLDLSVAYMVSVSAVLSSVVFAGATENTPLAVGASLGAGALVGLVNGLVITKLRVHPFIATLGMALILQGWIFTATQDFTGKVPPSFQWLGYGSIGPFPVPIVLFALIASAAWAMLTGTRFGHHLYATGGSEQTARLSGIRTHRVIIAAHVLCALCAAVAGLYLASREGSGDPNVGTGGHYDLFSIAAVVLGGSPLSGGKGGVPGTVAGVLIFSVLEKAFNDLGFDPFLKDAVLGVIIIAAVASYALRSVRKPA